MSEINKIIDALNGSEKMILKLADENSGLKKNMKEQTKSFHEEKTIIMSHYSMLMLFTGELIRSSKALAGAEVDHPEFKGHTTALVYREELENIQYLIQKDVTFGSLLKDLDSITFEEACSLLTALRFKENKS